MGALPSKFLRLGGDRIVEQEWDRFDPAVCSLEKSLIAELPVHNYRLFVVNVPDETPEFRFKE
jgi:hypothetical protein